MNDHRSGGAYTGERIVDVNHPIPFTIHSSSSALPSRLPNRFAIPSPPTKPGKMTSRTNLAAKAVVVKTHPRTQTTLRAAVRANVPRADRQRTWMPEDSAGVFDCKVSDRWFCQELGTQGNCRCDQLGRFNDALVEQCYLRLNKGRSPAPGRLEGYVSWNV